jgi:hypothetical protein
MSRLTALKAAKNRNDIAALLHTSEQGLNAILYSQPIANRYTTFQIPKKHGGTRTIKAPDKKLKLLQQKLSLLLQDCLDEIEATKNAQKHNAQNTGKCVAHGFKRGRSIISNAQQHRNHRWVFNIDLKDFFPSINFGRVRGFFLKNKNFMLQQDVATVLAKIACDENALPQGSPCSPVISNLITHILDMHIVHLAIKCKCTFTRYADDLTFSTNQRDFPQGIACQTNSGALIWMPGDKLQAIIKHSGFEINDKKTHMQFRDSRQNVTGLVVNRKVNIPSEYRLTTRAMVHRLFRTGSFQITGRVTNNGSTQLEMRAGRMNELHGRLGFIDEVDLHNSKLDSEKGEPNYIKTKESMYRQFLIYRDFYVAEKPVILCEGKTDNVYLKHAIRSLASQLPDLADVDGTGKITLKVRLYKYTKTSTGRILGLKDGGSSHLAQFISTYKRDTDKYSAPGLTNPVIVLFDNDSGKKPICSAAKAARLNGQAVNVADPFSHIIKNLYIVPTPLPTSSQESKIEDFFDANIKNTVIAGKRFSTDNNFDKSQFYGKSEFADRVVTPHAGIIDFNGFDPLLQNIAMVIREHAKAVEGGSVV